MKSIWLKLVVIGIAAIVAGCGAKKDPVAQTTVRIVNLAPESGAVGMQTGNDPATAVFTNVAYQTSSAYKSFDSGSVRVRITGTAGTLTDNTLSLPGGVNSTLVVYGGAASFNQGLYVEAGNNSANGNFGIRLANFSPNLPAMDVYMTAAATTDISQLSATLSGVGARGISAYADVLLANNNITLTEAGTKNVIFSATAQTYAEKKNYTLLAYSIGSSRLPNLVLAPDDGSATISLINSKLARIRMVNGVSDSAPIVFKSGTTNLFANIPYQGMTSYVVVPAGASSFRIEQASTPGTAAAVATPTLVGGTDYTMVLAGSALQNSATLLQFTDNAMPPASAKARLRFLNAASNVGALDIYQNFSSLLNGLAASSASAYTDVTPGTLDFQVNRAGGISSIITLNGNTITTGLIYTVVLMGQSGFTAGIVRQDN